MALHKNRPTVHREYLGFVRLWRDDLAEMVAVIAESSNGQPVEIQLGDEYTVDEIEDLVDYPDQRVEQVTVVAAAGRVRLTLTPVEASISVVEPNLTDRGMVGEVLRIALRRRAWSLFIRSALSSGKVGRPVLMDILSDKGSIERSGAIIFTQTKQEAPPFWLRKRDDILIAIVSLLVGGAIGYLVNMFT
jgi:hypothetical protein